MHRMDEGSVGQGLTVQDAVQLLRSSLPAQQVAALRTINAVLRQARPAGIGIPDAVTAVPMLPSRKLSPGSTGGRSVQHMQIGKVA